MNPYDPFLTAIELLKSISICYIHQGGYTFPPVSSEITQTQLNGFALHLVVQCIMGQGKNPFNFPN